LLALGPLLQIGGVNTGILLPYALLTHVPGVDIAHRPSHFVVLAVVALVPLAALGVAALQARLRLALHQPLLVALALLALVELFPPTWTLAQSRPEPIYQALQGAGGALIDLPPRLESSAPLEAQLVHGLPIMGGFVSRTPAYPFADETPVVRDLWALAPLDTVQIPSGADDALAVLNAFDLRYIVIHWRDLTATQRASMQQLVGQVLPGVRPAYDDGDLTLYHVPEAPLRPFGYFQAGWYGEEREGQRRWRWMGGQGAIRLVNPAGKAVSVRLQLVAQSYAETSQVALTLNGAPAGQWRVARADTPLTLEILLPPGDSTLRLEAPTVPEQGRSQRQLSIVIVASKMR
ncbi:MAG TPA: hypothetical protein VFT99_21120, partial [Roseiflexaceae bacterium]|nr:hypothetical protein [Roseiflexaceae bacterium]